MSQVVEVIISPTGEAKTSVTGVKGTSCKDLTKSLEAKFGAAIEQNISHEYYEAETQVEIKVESEG